MKALPSPEEFFGFRIGEDKKLARWDKIAEYFKLLGKRSEKIEVIELGKTVKGNSFIVAFISSPSNLKDKEIYRKISRKLAFPNDISEKEARDIAREGKAVIAISGGLHSSEVGGTQTLIELAYELIVRDDKIVKEILNNVIIILFPCLNPDGQIMVVDWYNKYVGTEYEGSPLPWLYHKYCGHDNNRDAFMLTQPESQYFAKIVYNDWIPQVYIDHHQMGNTAARMFISPEMDPIYPEVDPLVWREIQFLGSYAAARLQLKGFKGVETYSPFTPDFVAAFQTIANYMNIIGMLTESASVKIATPVYIHPHQLKGYRRGRLSDIPQINYPDPWPGGWWRLRNIVEYQKESTYAILEAIAKHKEEILYNMYVKARRSIERGLKKSPYAFIISKEQHDYLIVLEMIEKLIMLGIEVHEADKQFEINGKTYPRGTIVIFTAQPRRALLMKLLEKYMYPDNELTRNREGNPISPYDLATERLADFMGVEVEEISEKFKGSFKKLEKVVYPTAIVKESKYGWLIDPRLNNSHKVVIKLLRKGYKVMRIKHAISVGDSLLPAGTFYVPVQDKIIKALKELAMKTGVSLLPLSKRLNEEFFKISIPRIGIYQRYYGGNIDEGWLRWVLDYFGVPYKVIHDKPIKEGKLSEEVDILILPSDSLALMKGENIEEELSKIWKRPIKLPPWPPEYRSGFGQAGIDNIKKFIENGGTLITIGRSYEIVTKGFKLALRDISEDLNDPKKYFCPGSTLNALVDNSHPIAWGMPKETKVLFTGKPILEIFSTYESDKYREIVRLFDKNILSSGWLIGEKFLSRKPMVLDMKHGKGRIIIYAFRPHFRGQTRATFKLLLNALYSLH